MPVHICGVQQDPCRTSRSGGSLLSGVPHRTSLPSGSGIPARNMAASVSSAILPPPSGIKKALGNRFLKALSFYFPHLNNITKAYCNVLDFTVLFQEFRFPQGLSGEAGIHYQCRSQAQSRFLPTSYRTGTAVPIPSEVPYSPQL